MNLELDADSAAALTKVLHTYVSDLRMEVAQTDNADYRKELVAEEETLKTILQKLEAGGTAPIAGS